MKKWILLVVALSLPSLAQAGTISFIRTAPAGGAPPVQSKNNGGNGTDLSTGFDTQTTAGNVIYVAVGMATTTWTMSAGPSNSCGDTFTEVSNSPVTGTDSRVRIYTAPTAGGCSTITMTSSVSAPLDVFLAEYNNMNTSSLVDCVASGTGNSVNLLTGTCTTSVTYSTLVSFGFQAVNSATYTAGSGFTIRLQDGGTGHSGAFEDENKTSAGGYTAAMTSSVSGNWIAHVVGLKSATQ